MPLVFHSVPGVYKSMVAVIRLVHIAGSRVSMVLACFAFRIFMAQSFKILIASGDCTPDPHKIYPLIL